MANAIVQRFIDQVRLAGKIFLTDGARLVCDGVIVLTVEPNMDAEYPTMYRLEIPKRPVGKKGPYGALFLACVCGGPMALFLIRKHLGKFLFRGQPFALKVGVLRIRATVDEENFVIQVKPPRRRAQ
jgi:hypothetical protein